jgi:F-type H+-transporting ATPase subunit epsilon
LDKVNLLIISPEGTILSDSVDGVSFPTVLGDIAVLPGHMPLFTKLKDGEILVRKAGEETSIAITGGFLEITDDRVNVMADYAIRSTDIEIDKAEQARKRAETALRSESPLKDMSAAEIQLKRSIVELKIAEKYRHKVKKPR